MLTCTGQKDVKDTNAMRDILKKDQLKKSKADYFHPEAATVYTETSPKIPNVSRNFTVVKRQILQVSL